MLTPENIICLLAGLPIGATLAALWIALRQRAELRRLRRSIEFPRSALR